MTLNVSLNNIPTLHKAVVVAVVSITWAVPVTADNLAPQITDAASTEGAPCTAEATHEHCVRAYGNSVTLGEEPEEEIEAFPTAVNSQITD
ncbi:hypothetical protein [Pacificibacter marinus]|uniref:hypothetical protein n=1 Tax=Pacificibacter marinus TaxID=658057 RepID=UPI001C06CD92|nr:hypothetical protein [Pacificibacter marinus]MBU2867690.1 hypothetical protein [Pacificibacter marinus]